jgi:hypothetical protein
MTPYAPSRRTFLRGLIGVAIAPALCNLTHFTATQPLLSDDEFDYLRLMMKAREGSIRYIAETMEEFSWAYPR